MTSLLDYVNELVNRLLNRLIEINCPKGSVSGKESDFITRKDKETTENEGLNTDSGYVYTITMY